MQPSVPGRDTGGFKVFTDKTVPMRRSVTLKVCLIIIVSNSGANNLASRHDSLNLKGSAESGEKND